MSRRCTRRSPWESAWDGRIYNSAQIYIYRNENKTHIIVLPEMIGGKKKRNNNQNSITEAQLNVLHREFLDDVAGST